MSSYCLKFIDIILSFEIKPILVFNGKNLPIIDNKLKHKQNILSQCPEEVRISKEAVYNNHTCDVTPELAAPLIKVCHEINVDCIVAPYESAAQLAFFNLIGKIFIIIISTLF